MASKQLIYEEQWLYLYLTGTKSEFSQQLGKMTELLTKDLKYYLSLNEPECKNKRRAIHYKGSSSVLKDCRYVTLSSKMQT